MATFNGMSGMREGLHHLVEELPEDEVPAAEFKRDAVEMVPSSGRPVAARGG